MRRLAPLIAILAVACGGGSGTGASAGRAPSPSPGTCLYARQALVQEHAGLPPSVIDPCRTYTATVITSRGQFEIRLDRGEAAPVTTNNFVFLSTRAFYNNLKFHRVEDFVVQGGDPSGNGSGGPGYMLPKESNESTWARGTVAMASSSQGVNGSQFFVLKQDSGYLARAGQFNPFGEVTSGMDVVDQIQQGDTIEGISVAG